MAVLAQLTDLHLRLSGDGPPESPALRAAVAALLEVRPLPDAVLVTGDVADTPQPDEYAAARAVLAELPMPVHVLPGNHDDRGLLREAFGLEGGDAPFAADHDVAGLRVCVVDTTIPGRPEGELPAERLGDLDARLAAAAGVPTVVALHHVPLRTGVAPMDALGLRDGDALAEVLARHPHVLRVLGGHVHRAATGELGGVPVWAGPAVEGTLGLDLTATDVIPIVPRGPGFSLHVLLDDGTLTSHAEQLPHPR